MRHIMALVILSLFSTLFAFDLEYIKPIPVEGDSPQKNETKPPTEVVLKKATQEELVIKDALAYVKKLDYRTYDWELIKHAYLGNTEVVRILLERDADPNATLAANGVSALQAALLQNNNQIAHMLLDKGADCIHWDNQECIALFYAAGGTYDMDVVARVRENTGLIYRDTKWRTAAIYAAVYDNVEVLEWLLENYGRYESMADDYSERGPGEYAAANGCLDMVQSMIERKIQFCDPAGILDYAIAAGAVDIVDYLVNTARVPVDASDLVIAAGGMESYYKWGISEMQVSLYDPRALLVKDYVEVEPVDWVVPQNYQTIFDMLVTKVDLNARDDKDITPLIACAMQNDYEGARVLIELGASPFLRYEGKTPLDIVLDNPKADPTLVKLLRNAMR